MDTPTYSGSDNDQPERGSHSVDITEVRQDPTVTAPQSLQLPTPTSSSSVWSQSTSLFSVPPVREREVRFVDDGAAWRHLMEVAEAHERDTARTVKKSIFTMPRVIRTVGYTVMIGTCVGLIYAFVKILNNNNLTYQSPDPVSTRKTTTSITADPTSITNYTSITTRQSTDLSVTTTSQSTYLAPNITSQSTSMAPEPSSSSSVAVVIEVATQVFETTVAVRNPETKPHLMDGQQHSVAVCHIPCKV